MLFQGRIVFAHLHHNTNQQGNHELPSGSDGPLRQNIRAEGWPTFTIPTVGAPEEIGQERKENHPLSLFGEIYEDETREL